MSLSQLESHQSIHLKGDSGNSEDRSHSQQPTCYPATLGRCYEMIRLRACHRAASPVATSTRVLGSGTTVDGGITSKERSSTSGEFVNPVIAVSFSKPPNTL